MSNHGKNLYAVRDNVAQTNVGGIYMFPHDTPAVRFFSDVASDPNTMVARHPKDHALLHIGFFNEDTCELTPTDTVRVVISGEAWLAMQQQQQNSTEG